ncbi:MAG: class I SAM-dependent methyltransferase [Methyloprofundus sp.]|nr:class I SAM-dependent methyltransferase [Methyloprofundus sp.]
MKQYNIDRKIKNNTNYPFWFSMLKEASEVVNLYELNSIVDFGCGSGGFTQLISHFFNNLFITGIEIDERLIAGCRKINKNRRISYISHKKMSSLPKVDLVFSQEVVYTQESLLQHAKEIFEILHNGGHYIFTIGCHIENPTWAVRRNKIRSSERYPVFDYSLQDIADAFYEAGFRVMVKKLPMHAPMKYVPQQDGEFSSISDMIRSSEEFKFLFIMLKPRFKS